MSKTMRRVALPPGFEVAPRVEVRTSVFPSHAVVLAVVWAGAGELVVPLTPAQAVELADTLDEAANRLEANYDGREN
jgi:hypothetical protein